MRYFVTTGTSLRTSSRCWQADKNTPRETLGDEMSTRELVEMGASALLKAQREAIEAVTRAMPVRGGKSATGYLGEACKVVNDYFDFRCWSNQKRILLPAELATLVAMQATEDHKLKPHSEIIFLYGKKNERESFLCAAVLKEIIERQNLRLKYEAQLRSAVHERAIDEYPWYDVEPTLSVGVFPEVSGLAWEPTDQQSFQAQVTGDGEQIPSLYEKLNAASGDRFILTAGFKGVIIALAIQIAHSSRRTEVFYLHDDESNEPVRLLVDGKKVEMF